VLTKTAFKKHAIRDWIYFEIGVAKAMWKALSQYKIFIWKDVALTLPTTNPFNCIKECQSFRMNSSKSRDTMLAEMRAIARNISITH
jgi:hypothetical protein